MLSKTKVHVFFPLTSLGYWDGRSLNGTFKFFSDTQTNKNPCGLICPLAVTSSLLQIAAHLFSSPAQAGTRLVPST